jgi:hypothetical protein
MPSLYGLSLSSILKNKPTANQLSSAIEAHLATIGKDIGTASAEYQQPAEFVDVRVRAVRHAVAAHCSGRRIDHSEDPYIYAAWLLARAGDQERYAQQLVIEETVDLQPESFRDITPTPLTDIGGEFLVAVEQSPLSYIESEVSYPELPQAVRQVDIPTNDPHDVIDYIIRHSQGNVTHITTTRNIYNLLALLAVGEPLPFPPIDIPVSRGFDVATYDERRRNVVARYITSLNSSLESSDFMSLINSLFTGIIGARPADVPSRYISFRRVTPDNVASVINDLNLFDPQHKITLIGGLRRETS